MPDDHRALLRTALAKALWHDGLMHVMSPEDLADTILNLGHIDEMWEVHKDDEEWSGGGWVTYRHNREEAMAYALKKDAHVRCRFNLWIDVPVDHSGEAGSAPPK